ncbi:unnamed protein product [Rodentolepis nana]|uniref:RING-type domain-containing protein n=1 Tax=Rodentolepis nana TaxID=102285 RepID=A0A158QI59_RODNA|nr:unnamed protein product [Rodentolepis nana]
MYSACRAIHCINSLPVSTIWIKKELIKKASPACNLPAPAENLESINDFLHQYDFFPDRKYDQKLRTLIPSQPISIKGDDHKLECNICLCDYRTGQKVRHLPCGHVFHRECVDKWLANAETCPKCRKHVVNALRLLLSSKESQSTRRRSQSSVNLPSSSFSSSQLQNIQPSVVVKHNRASILRLELARSRRTANTEFERAINSNSTTQAKLRITSNIPEQIPTHSGETLSASSSIEPSAGANEGISICTDDLHSTNDKGDEMLNHESSDEPRRKAAEAAMQRYEQFHKKTD